MGIYSAACLFFLRCCLSLLTQTTLVPFHSTLYTFILCHRFCSAAKGHPTRVSPTSGRSVKKKCRKKFHLAFTTPPQRTSHALPPRRLTPLPASSPRPRDPRPARRRSAPVADDGDGEWEDVVEGKHAWAVVRPPARGGDGRISVRV
ncbi:hypothetical protein B0J18DRAFT_206723 [Chaetomium sp. MPI-SDFR-AT-0129]|nr:hypothetical protein B0J18DRAFT_206723 [Chaetomium sp. MPI-SDFR-AT-0129]